MGQKGADGPGPSGAGKEGARMEQDQAPCSLLHDASGLNPGSGTPASGPLTTVLQNLQLYACLFYYYI